MTPAQYNEYQRQADVIEQNEKRKAEKQKTVMNKEFIPYEQALALKELGFNEPCLGFYRIFSDGDIELLINSNSNMRHLEAPTFLQAFRFFRKKYKLSGTPQYFTGGYYCYTINDMKDTEKSNRLFTEFESYEEAEIACLEKLIEIVKSKI
jgi:hypothetical protein